MSERWPDFVNYTSCLWDTIAQSAGTQNLLNRRMTERDVLLLKSARHAVQSLDITMPASRTQSYGSSGWPQAHLGVAEQRHRPLIGVPSGS